MKLISPQLHGMLDYALVVVFALAPTVAGLPGAAATLSYGLAAVHLLLTLMSDLPVAVAPLIPTALHGIIEAAVGLALGLVGWLAFDGMASTFFLAMAVAVLVVWLLTDYMRQP